MRRWTTEALGTSALVLIGTGTTVVNDVSGGALGQVGIALAFGLVVAAMIYAVGDVSGAHFNPAVTLDFAASRRHAPRAGDCADRGRPGLGRSAARTVDRAQRAAQTASFQHESSFRSNVTAARDTVPSRIAGVTPPDTYPSFAMPWNVLLRDLALLACTLAVLGWDASLRAGAESGAFALGIATLAGLLLALVGYLAHEWGHLLGARLSRSTVAVPRSAATIFTFFYDTERNSPRQFLSMSLGGFVASGVMVALYVSVLPLEALSTRVALLATALGVLATVVLEFPVAWRVYRGAGLPVTGVAYVSTRNPRS